LTVLIEKTDFLEKGVGFFYLDLATWIDDSAEYILLSID